MTRREEIENAAKQKYPYEGGIKGLICENSIPIFIQGAEWADKTMIERSCKWLENRHNIEKCLNVLTSRTEDLSKAFRQAMEE